jgi:Cu2+-exporting ATPase
MSAPDSRQCAHCRLPLPARPFSEQQGERTLLFCCGGCLLVFRVIGTAGEGGRADWFLAKLGLAALLSGNVMMFQSLSYFGSLDQMGPEVLQSSSWIMLVCSIVIYLLLGVPMLKIAGRGALRGTISLESLIGLGTLAAIGYSAFQTFRGGHELYYDSGTMVLVFVTLGQYLDAESRRKAIAALSPAVDSSRRQARVRRAAGILAIHPQAVQAGELVEVRSGEEIPVDGLVREGSADIHEPLFTGEWRPRPVAPGDTVCAGSTAIDGALLIVASGAAETLADRIARFAIEARDRKAPIEATVDRVVAVFIPAVAIIAAAALFAWGIHGSWAQGLQAALSVLVIACPCALGIATPLATTMALLRATTRGTLVRSGAVLEALSRVRAVAFDKTGTLTLGRPHFAAFYPVAQGMKDSGGAPIDALALAAAVESRVNHPFASAIVAHAAQCGADCPQATQVHVTAGAGAEGLVSGRRVLVGKRSWLDERGIQVPRPVYPDTGGSLVAVAVDGTAVGEIVLEDPPRREAKAALLALKQLGISSHLVSGDRAAVVARNARALGCESYRAELSPQDKLDRIRELRQTGTAVAMVGDGINDAPALASADAGIAFGPAADLARETADVTIQREDLFEVVRLLELSRRTFAIVRQNLAWAFGYNLVGITIAAFGLLRPVVAAVAMVLSSVCVVANSMRLGRDDPREFPTAAADSVFGAMPKPLNSPRPES